MSIFSKVCLTSFEIFNEIYIAIGSGFLGIVVLVNHGYETNQMLRTLTLATVSVGSLIYVFQASSERKMSVNKKQIVFISGCDSGLGFSLALHASDLGFTVIAGFLNLESEGAKEIQKLNMNCSKIKQLELDVTKHDSVYVAAETIRQFIDSNPKYELHAVVNNAAVMVFGEFEWQTERLIQQQLEVNLMGAMRLSKQFIPLLRKSSGRLINITSHCSQACLPGLAVYGAAKTGLMAFNDGLRVELDKYGVKVISVIPGSFVTQSNIMARHPDHVREMHKNFTAEQHEFYEDYFQRYNAHLLGLTPPKMPQKIVDKKLYDILEHALVDDPPKAYYKIEPMRYRLYHYIFKFSPVFIRDYFMVKFLQLPEYNLQQTW